MNQGNEGTGSGATSVAGEGSLVKKFWKRLWARMQRPVEDFAEHIIFGVICVLMMWAGTIIIHFAMKFGMWTMGNPSWPVIPCHCIEVGRSEEHTSELQS